MSKKTKVQKRTGSLRKEEDNKLLLEEYKNCTEVLLDANKLIWTRFSIYLAMIAALVPAWSILLSFTFDKPLPYSLLPLALALPGLVISLVWVFVMVRAQAIDDFWMDRLRAIERDLGEKMQTFSDLRELRFWVCKPYWKRRQARVLQLIPPGLFVVIWSILVLVQCWLTLIVVWASIGLVLLLSYKSDRARKEKEWARILGKGWDL